MSNTISSDVERVLRSLQIQGNTVKIIEQLDRSLYQAVNEVLERLGGKWNKSAKVHIFPGDPTERLNTVLQAGKLDPKIKTGYFPTPPEIGKRMVEMLDLKPGDRVLEPSAGQGGLLDQLPKGTHVTIGEILPENIQILKEKGYTVNFDNFMGVEIGEINKVVMNPPFENQQDIEHVTRALRMLQPGGTLVSVMSPGIKFRDNKKTTDFLEMLDRDYNYEITDLPAGSFKESETGVNTVLLKVEKPMSTPSTVLSGFTADTSKVSKELADRSHMGTSWDPEKRAEQEIAGFGQYVDEVYANLKRHATSIVQKTFLDTEIKRFQDSFAKKYNDLLARKGKTMSTFITGGSNFNVRKADKANDAEHAKYEEMIEFRDRAQAAILRELKKMAIEEAGGELEVLKKKLAEAIEMQEVMKKVNAILRSNRSNTEKKEMFHSLTDKYHFRHLQPDFGTVSTFPPYALTNNNANIHRMQERVKELEKKEVTASSTTLFEGGSIEDNAQRDRVQILFDKKPDESMIEKLKREGWRWSPSNSAWQRKRTDMALYSARRIVSLPQEAPKFVTPKQETIEITKTEYVSVAPDKLVSIVERSNVQAPNMIVLPYSDPKISTLPKDHYYFFRSKPSIGMYPSGEVMKELWVKAQVTQKGNMAFGWVAYREELSPDTLKQFDLFIDEVEAVEHEKAKLYLSAISRFTLNELREHEATVRRWSIRFPYMEKELEDEYKLYIELRQPVIEPETITSNIQKYHEVQKQIDELNKIFAEKDAIPKGYNAAMDLKNELYTKIEAFWIYRINNMPEAKTMSVEQVKSAAGEAALTAISYGHKSVTISSIIKRYGAAQTEQPERIKSLPFKKPIPFVTPSRVPPKRIITPVRRLYPTKPEDKQEARQKMETSVFTRLNLIAEKTRLKRELEQLKRGE